jgi:alpha-1,6-mannosyltransferase
VAELVDDQVGQLAEVADGAGVAEAVQALFARDLEVVSRAARARAVARHSWDHVFEGLGSLYAGLTGNPAFAGQSRISATH